LNKNTIHKRRGFTLIELLISVAIIGILTAMVTVKYKAFDSTTILKGAAYEIALTIREAQIKSMSAVRGTTGFDFPRGVSFVPGNAPTTASKTYNAFQFESATVYPYYDTSEPLAVLLNSFTLDRTMYVSDVCVVVGGTETCSSGGTINRLDVSFRRPEFKAIFYAAKTSDGTNFSTSIEKATIKVTSTNNTANVFLIDVSQLGQISVSKQP